MIRLHRFKWFLLTFGLFILFSAFIRYSDAHYLSEKLFWHAEEHASKILKTKPKESLKEKDYQEIIAAYRRVVDTCPLEPLAAKSQFIISKIYFTQGEKESAQKELRHIIENFFSDAQLASRAQFTIGRIYETQGKWKEAFEEYDKIVDLYPLTPLGLKTPIYIMQYYHKKNNQLEEEKAYRMAIRHYETLLRKYMDTKVAPVVENYLAMAHFQKGLKRDEDAVGLGVF